MSRSGRTWVNDDDGEDETTVRVFCSEVSWIRRKDYHLLTVGLTTYSSDQRFQAIHLQHSEDWTLKVRFVQKRDAGIYECQVSSHPPTSIFLRLEVVEARAQISGPTEKYLKPGSTLRLQCSVVQTTEAPAFVFWYHNSRMINYDAERGINVTTNPAERLSDLLIPAASVSHAGNYTCVPNNAVPASIYVHIFNAKRLYDLLIPAASVSHAGNYICIPNNAVPASIYVHIFNDELITR
ncbi:hypothetical protein evm_013022 [Chilo suppressalis]|nr:hypothetical protein evm_013022 [Chilo suppressalis]